MADLMWGVGSAHRALLVHGIASSAQVWWRVASGLAGAGVETTAVDLRGHGRSPRADSYSLEDCIGDLEWYVRREGPFDVVAGHSFGGSMVGLADVGAAARLLVDPVLETGDPAGLRRQLSAELDETPAEIAAANPSWHPDDVHWKAWSAAQMTPATLDRLLEQWLPSAVTDAVAGLDGPTIVLAADPAEGGLLSPDAVATLAVNPQIEVVDLPGVGHSVQRHDPGLVVDAVVRLLRLR